MIEIARACRLQRRRLHPHHLLLTACILTLALQP